MRQLILERFLATLLLGLVIAPSRAAESDPRLRESNDSGMGLWLKRIGGARLPGENERSHNSITNAFRAATAESTRGTVRVLSDGLQSSLGIVVRADGMILTKASELNGKLECVLSDGRRVAANKLAQRDEHDLALLRIAAEKLPTASWSNADIPAVGTWLITSNLDEQPLAIGVVSSPPQTIPAPQTILGVRLEDVARGVRVNRIVPGSGAARAGIRAGDVIESINGRSVESPDHVTDLIRTMLPGEKVTLSVLRETEALSVTATLGDHARLGGQEQAELMDSLGGPLSKRRTGFASVIQHDSVVRPRECGGPVVDLTGQVVGINIARANRVATFALPAKIARQAATEMLSEFAAKTLSPEASSPVSTSRQ